MASANSLDLRPATASANMTSSRTRTDPSSAAMAISSTRAFGNCQQQRSYTDLDSSSEGFVREASLGHLSASLFTPTAMDASMRLPLQQLWGSFDMAITQNSFSNQGQQQQQQPHIGVLSADSTVVAAAAAAGHSMAWEQQAVSSQKALSPTWARQDSATGFLQRLEGCTGSSSSSTGKLQVVKSICSRSAAVTSARESQRSCPQSVDEDVLSCRVGPAADLAQRRRNPEASMLVEAWGAPAARPACHQPAACSQVQQQRQHAAADVEQRSWAVASSGRRVKSGAEEVCPAGVSAATGSNPMPQGPHDATTAEVVSCGGASGPPELLLQQSWTDHMQVLHQQQHQQQLMQRPPSRQRPPSESLHLFNSFVDDA